jgi:hypothetical protein
MLIIVFHVNPRYRKLERWYVAGSFVMGLGPPLVPAALDHFGKDTTPWGNCFMRDVEVHSRIVKLIVDVVSRRVKAVCVEPALMAVPLARSVMCSGDHFHSFGSIRLVAHFSPYQQSSVRGQPLECVIVVRDAGNPQRAIHRDCIADQLVSYRFGYHEHTPDQ